MNATVETKKAELLKIISDSLSNEYIFAEHSNPEKIYHDLAKCGFVSIESPVIDEQKGSSVFHCLTFDSFKSSSELKGGRTIKPGNIILNLQKLIDSLPSIVALSVSMAADIPILKVCSALSLWKELKGIMTVEITKMQSIVIMALWKYRDHTNHIHVDYGYNRVNYFCKAIGEEAISWIDYNQAVDELLKLKCIDITEEVIWLRESISKEWR